MVRERWRIWYFHVKQWAWIVNDSSIASSALEKGSRVLELSLTSTQITSWHLESAQGWGIRLRPKYYYWTTFRRVLWLGYSNLLRPALRKLARTGRRISNRLCQSSLRRGLYCIVWLLGSWGKPAILLFHQSSSRILREVWHGWMLVEYGAFVEELTLWF